MIGPSTTLKAFNETEKMAIARSLVSLFRVFVVFFIFTTLRVSGIPVA
jgi:hypothetical protein